MTARMVPGQNWDMTGGGGMTMVGPDYFQGGLAPSWFPQQQEQIQPEQPAAPAPQMDRNAFRDAWMSAGQMSPQDADNWMRSHGATPVAGGEKAGRWQVPGGDVLDTQIGRGHAMASGGMITPGWTHTGMPQWAGGQPQQQQPQMPQWGGGGFGWGRLGGGWGGGGQLHDMRYRGPQQGGWGQPGFMQNMQNQMWQRQQQQRQQPQRGGGWGGGIGPSKPPVPFSYNTSGQQQNTMRPQPPQQRPQQQQQPKYW